jgi:hypothetical protein
MGSNPHHQFIQRKPLPFVYPAKAGALNVCSQSQTGSQCAAGYMLDDRAAPGTGSHDNHQLFALLPRHHEAGSGAVLPRPQVANALLYFGADFGQIATGGAFQCLPYGIRPGDRRYPHFFL